MRLKGQDIAVIGAGVAGLASATALARHGARVTVFERAPAIAEVGAGLQVSPNGLAVLDALGLGPAVRRVGRAAQAVVLRDGLSSRPVTRLALGPRVGRYLFLHRADLIDLLAGAAHAAGVRVQTDAAVDRITPGAPPWIGLARGGPRSPDLVIGADGLHSALRGVLNGTAAPAFTGQVAWRAVVPNCVDHPDEAWVHMGPGRHVVSYPLRGGDLVNLVAVEERRDWVAEGWAHEDDPDAMRAAFAGFTGPVPRLMAGADRVGLWGLFRHPVAKVWHGAGTALVGDAAHPTLPFLAQGANMALEDAWVLAATLAADGPGAAALARYQQARRDRVVKVIAAADGNAWKYHLRNPLVRRTAHLGLGVLGRAAPDRLMRGFDWLYGHDVTATHPG